jgi:hypothetical protein
MVLPSPITVVVTCRERALMARAVELQDVRQQFGNQSIGTDVIA